MIVHQRYLLPEQINLLLVFTDISLATFDKVLKKVEWLHQFHYGVNQTYLDVLDALFDIDDLGRVARALVHMLADDMAPSVHKLLVT